MVIWQITVYFLLGLNLLATLFSGLKVFRALKKFSSKDLRVDTLTDTSSVSVCIPARNESHAMTQCLEKVLVSNYPKLEIIVCDDESVDETSILIKSFAHAGVRFVDSKVPSDDWLGRNHALDRLLKESSGTYVLFMDVDNNLAPDTISKLVAHIEGNEAKMLSILPSRFDAYRLSAVFGNLRHYWELIKSSGSNPPVSSSAWMVNRREFLNDFGGFEAHKSSIQPESAFAKKYSPDKSYQFLLSSPALGLGYEKRWSSQIETGIRQLYPLADHKWYKALFYLLGLLLLNAPSLGLIIGIISSDIALVISTISLHILAVFIYTAYLRQTRQKNWSLASLVWPYLILQELVVFVISIVAYKTGKVAWKGRQLPLPATDL